MWASFCLSKFRALAIIRRHIQQEIEKPQSDKAPEMVPKGKWDFSKNDQKGCSEGLNSDVQPQRDWCDGMKWGPDYQTLSAKILKPFSIKRTSLVCAYQ